MSLGLKEGCPAAPIEFSIYHSFIMKELKARLLENQEESIRVGFGTEEFNDLPLIRENAPTKKMRWARRVEQTSKSIDFLLFADDTTSLCRRSNLQNRKEILKQTFKNWKLILNDVGAHHRGERSRGTETTAEENGQNSKNTRYSSERRGYVSSRSKETAHGGKESMVQIVTETSFMGPLQKIGGTDCHSGGGSNTSLWM